MSQISVVGVRCTDPSMDKAWSELLQQLGLAGSESVTIARDCDAGVSSGELIADVDMLMHRLDAAVCLLTGRDLNNGSLAGLGINTGAIVNRLEDMSYRLIVVWFTQNPSLDPVSGWWSWKVNLNQHMTPPIMPEPGIPSPDTITDGTEDVGEGNIDDNSFPRT